MYNLTNILIRLVGFFIILMGLSSLAFGYFDEQYFGILISLPLMWVGWHVFDYPTAKRLKIEAKIKSALEFTSADYAHVYSDTGIAVNNTNQSIFLVVGEHRKLYNYEDVRGWRYVYADDDGGSGASMAYQMGVQDRNAEESGLFVQVKDVNMPEWHIKFAYNAETKKELKRWMEILRQSINNDR